MKSKLDPLDMLGLAGEGLVSAASGVVGTPVQNHAVRPVVGRRVVVDVEDRNDLSAGPATATLPRDSYRVALGCAEIGC